jgi:hypothetical protein
MTLVLSPVWNGQQFLDQNGNLLAGGQIYTYAGGSFTVQQTTYTDDSGDTPNTNPIILNASGNMDTGFWITEGVYYNYQLLDTYGNQIMISENVYVA